MASPSPPQLIVLDDKDPSITYSGSGWANDTGYDNLGDFGAPYLHTLHKTISDGSVSLDFNGTSIDVLGTTIVEGSAPSPQFECFVDNVKIGRSAKLPPPGSANNVDLCQANNLEDRRHTLRIDIKITSTGQVFWLDQMMYTPSRNVSLDGKTFMLQSTDPSVHFDEHWSNYTDIGNMTSQSGSSAQVKFYGTSISWVSFVPGDKPNARASGLRSLDGAPPTPFVVEGSPQGSPTKYNQILFTAIAAEVGHHTLNVTFLGSNKTTPLTLDFLYVTNGTSTSDTNHTAPPGDARPSPTRASSPDASNQNHGAIYGGVFGGLGFALLLLAAVLFWRRRQRSRETPRGKLMPPGRPHGDINRGGPSASSWRALSARARSVVHPYSISESGQSVSSLHAPSEPARALVHPYAISESGWSPRSLHGPSKLARSVYPYANSESGWSASVLQTPSDRRTSQMSFDTQASILIPYGSPPHYSE